MFMPVFLSLVVVPLAIVCADKSFSPVDQAIWIDRLNYFRTTGLPWPAANMQRIGWKADLAKTAASSAAKCSATTGPGVNVYQSSSPKSSSTIDEAIQQWVVETSKKTLRTLAQPGVFGVEIGKGTYTSYSQIVWANTTSVGCASATCSGGEMVVCQFSPPGNDGFSAWYVHADPASKCPSGTSASLGLCVDKGDAANEQIAPIPAGKLTYEVYPAYVADMQTVLIEAARGIANGEQLSTATMAVPAAMTATPASSSKTPSKTPSASSNKDAGGTQTSTTEKTPSSLKTPSASLNKDVGGTQTSATEKTPSSSKTPSAISNKDVGGAKTSAADETSSSSKTPSASSNKDVGGTQTSATEKTPSSSILDNLDLEVSSSSTETRTFTSKSPDKTNTHSSMETSTENKSSTTELLSGEDLVPGTVKVSSDNGSTFSNEETSTKNQTSSSPASTPNTGNDERITASTPIPGSSAVTGTNHKAPSGISVAGMTGIAVLAIVGVAAFGAIMSYKRNQRRQREIMRDGGIQAN